MPRLPQQRPSRYRGAAGLLVAVSLASPAWAEASNPEPLRVCADPNNLPFSNQELAGFENKLAGLVARALGRQVAYTWHAQRRGFVRETLKAGSCDLVMGVPAHYDPVETTRPYYRSTYVFLSRAERNLGISSITDARLRSLKIGVHLIGDDGANTPPAHALGEQGITSNVVGYTVYGDYREPNPPVRLADAVARGEIDVAALWGPIAGFAAQQSPVRLSLAPITGTERFQPLRFTFAIAMGVRKGDHVLRDRLNEVISSRHAEIQSLLRSYGVPLLPLEANAAGGGNEKD